MKAISLIAAGVVALCWTTARAETPPSSDTANPPNDGTAPPPETKVYVSPDPFNAPEPTPAPPPPTTTTVDVNTPPGTTVDVNVNPPAAPAPLQARPVAEPERGPVYRPWVARTGGGLFVGGGYQDFTNSNLRSITGAGGYWSVRLIGGMRRIVGLEAAYVGDARNINALGLSGNAHLVSNGLEGALRVNIPIVSPNQMSLFEPFGFVGLGWAHYNVTNTSINTSDVAPRDDIMTLPLGGGLAFAHRGLMFDARFTYRKTYYNDLVPGENLNNWGIGGQLGFGF